MPDTLPLNSAQYRRSIADFKWIKCLAQRLNPLLRMRLKPGIPRSQATALPTELMCIWFFVMHACLVYLTNKCLNVSDWCLVLGWRIYLILLLYYFFLRSRFQAHTFLFVYMRQTLLSTSVPHRWSIYDFSCLSNVDKVSCPKTQAAAPTKAWNAMGPYYPNSKALPTELTGPTDGEYNSRHI